MSGVSTANLSSVVTIDDLLGNRDGSSVRIPLPMLVALIRQSIGGPSVETRDQLYSNLGWAAGSLGTVWNDATEARRGVYLKAGAAGAGSWSRIGDLPTGTLTSAQLATLATLTEVQAGAVITLASVEGTGDAVTAAIPAALSRLSLAPGMIVALRWPATNGAPSPSLTIGGTAFEVRRQTVPVTVAAGDLKGDGRYLMLVSTISPPVLRLLHPVNITELNGS